MQRFVRFFVIALIGVSTLLLSGCTKEKPANYQVDLEVWGVFDDTDAYSELFGEFSRINPFVRSIQYRKLSVDTYQQDLLNALAAGRGPDIFMIRNGWTPAFADKIISAPDTMLDERVFRETFVDVAADNFIGSDKKIYAVPLSVDSLGLFYNKDLFNEAGVTEPPRTWGEFEEAVRKLTKIDAFGNVVQAGAAMGTADPNINRAPDLFSALLLQRGVGVVNPETGQVQFNLRSSQAALEFYTQFANPLSVNYTWNPRQHYSLDAFYEGRVAMMVNYSWHYQTIVRKNAKLNIGVAPLPQFDDPGAQRVNYPNYWAFAVSKNKLFDAQKNNPAQTGITTQDAYNQVRTHEAWQLLRFLSMPHKGTVSLQNALTKGAKDFPVAVDPAAAYVVKLGKPAARRDLIEQQKTDPVIGPFAEGNLIAKDYAKRNVEAVEGIWNELIDTINRGTMSTTDALRLAENRLNVFMQP